MNRFSKDINFLRQDDDTYCFSRSGVKGQGHTYTLKQLLNLVKCHAQLLNTIQTEPFQLRPYDDINCFSCYFLRSKGQDLTLYILVQHCKQDKGQDLTLYILVQHCKQDKDRNVWIMIVKHSTHTSY